MLELTADLNTVQSTQRWLAEVTGRLPLAQATALNRTAEDVLYRQRENMARVFTIREPRMLPPRYLPTVWRARPDQLSAWANLGGKDVGTIGEKRERILSAFEQGLPKLGDPMFRPTKALRPTRQTVIPRKMYPRNMVGIFNADGQFKGLGTKANTKIRMKKLKGGDIAVYRKQVGRYFMIPGKGIYERQGSGTIGTTRKLWTYDPAVRRPPILRWDAIGQAEVAAVWQRNFANAVDYALAAKAK